MSQFTSADDGERAEAQAPEHGFAPLDAGPADAPPPSQQQDSAPFAPPYPAPYPQPGSYPQPGPYPQANPYGAHPQAPVPPWGSQAPAQAGAPPLPAPGWNQAAYGYPPMAPAPLATAPKRSKGRLWAIAGAVVAVAGLVTGAVLASGSHSATPAAGASASDSATAASDGSAQGLLTGSLTSALLPLPSGATALNESDAGPDGSLTLDQYLKILYPTSSTERAALQRRDFVAAADRLFRTSTSSAEVFLVQFQAASGAESYGLALSAAHHRDHAADPSFTIPGLADGTGYEESALDSFGNTRSFVYGSLGNVTVLIHFYTPATLDRTALMSVVSAQIVHLQAAEG